jgi:polysaccharide export outer membrane protein
MKSAARRHDGRLLQGAVFAMVCATLAAPFALADATTGSPTLKMSGALGTSFPQANRPAADITVPVAQPQAASTAEPKSTQLAALKPLASRDYRIGPDDLLEVQVFGVDSLTRSVRVNSRGFISLPLIGNLQVGGLTAQQAEALVVSKLAESYLQDPQVSLFIKEYTSQRVTIEGAVNRPGVYPLHGTTTLLQALAVAGGQGSLSDMSQVMLFRSDTSGRRETLVYDVERIRGGEMSDPEVLNEDLIVVKRSPARVFFKDSIVRDLIDTVNPFR